MCVDLKYDYRILIRISEYQKKTDIACVAPAHVYGNFTENVRIQTFRRWIDDLASLRMIGLDLSVPCFDCLGGGYLIHWLLTFPSFKFEKLPIPHR